MNISILSPSLVALLGKRNEELFPRLRYLQVTTATYSGHSDAGWMLLGGTSLRRLEVSGITSEQQVPHRDRDHPKNFNAFCRHLSTRTPNIQRLVLSEFPSLIPPLPIRSITAFCTAVQSLSSLQAFKWDSTSALHTGIASMAVTHQSLSDLSLSPLEEWPTSHEGVERCRSLPKLELCGTMVTLGTCMQTIADPLLLSKLSLYFTDEDLDPRAFDPLSNLFRDAKNLQQIDLGFAGGPIAWTQLHPALDCKMLSDLSIHTPRRAVGLDDEALKELASALPHLKSLIILTAEEHPLYEISLYGLAFFARHNPKLEKLAIEITTRTLGNNQPELPSDLNASISRPFQGLDLLDSEINVGDDAPDFLGPQRTAAFIAALWPSLRSSGFSVMLFDESEKTESWEQVKTALGNLDVP